MVDGSGRVLRTEQTGIYEAVLRVATITARENLDTCRNVVLRGAGIHTVTGGLDAGKRTLLTVSKRHLGLEAFMGLQRNAFVERHLAAVAAVRALYSTVVHG